VGLPYKDISMAVAEPYRWIWMPSVKQTTLFLPFVRLEGCKSFLAVSITQLSPWPNFDLCHYEFNSGSFVIDVVAATVTSLKEPLSAFVNVML